MEVHRLGFDPRSILHGLGDILWKIRLDLFTASWTTLDLSLVFGNLYLDDGLVEHLSLLMPAGFYPVQAGMAMTALLYFMHNNLIRMFNCL